ncbi:MAG: YHS domain-containing protein [Candidatus Thorarchaeota archaeon]
MINLTLERYFGINRYYTTNNDEETAMQRCPVCGMMVDEHRSPSTVYKGKTFYFHKPMHKEMFDKDPEKFLSRQQNSSGMHM